MSFEFRVSSIECQVKSLLFFYSKLDTLNFLIGVIDENQPVTGLSPQTRLNGVSRRGDSRLRVGFSEYGAACSLLGVVHDACGCGEGCAGACGADGCRNLKPSPRFAGAFRLVAADDKPVLFKKRLDA
jgi:hypothetical protein